MIGNRFQIQMIRTDADNIHIQYAEFAGGNQGI